ncbi:MAG: MFS transporter [Rhodothermaceae bacterium]|nr:MFS transporter [Rhodothermaceae bacterium]
MKNWLVHKSPVYYGWIVMVAGTLGLVMTSPGQSYVVSIFIESFIADLEISRSVVSSLYTAATLAGSFALPFVGRLIDRYGSRQVVTIISFVFGLSCIYLGFVQNAIMLGIGFICIRFLGQGSLGLVSMNAINQWWIARRGLVMGISGLFVALLGLGLFPVGVNWLIPELGWRNTYIALGCVLLFGMVPIGYIFFRDRPEQFGLHPDGIHPIRSFNHSAPPPIEEDNWTRNEAMRTPAFWVIAGSAGTISMLTTGIVFHLVSIFADQGLDADTAASVFIPLSITMGAVTLGGGILADRISGRYLLAIILSGQIALLLMALHLSSAWLIVLFGILLGAVSGLYRIIMSVLWANYFGRLHLGSITGVAQTIAVGGSALGPLPLGLARDWFGNYEAVLLWCIAIPLLFGIANIFVGQPKRQLTEVSG